MSKEDFDRIEYVRDLTRKSRFDPKNHGVTQDKSKDRRWVDPRRVEERKNGHGYQFVRPKDGVGIAADNTIRTDGGMVLMERPKEIADERRKQKDIITRSKTQSAKESLRNRIEAMSSQVGRNLHKYVDDLDGEK